jgi:hypothetical protein
MIKRLLIILSFFVAERISAQDGINFNPKSLYPELKKFSEGPSPEISEMIIPSSIMSAYGIPGKYYSVEYENGNGVISFVYIGRVKSCRTGGCSASFEPWEGDTEYFDYFILFDKEMSVQLVKVYNYQATHGQEITSKGWLKQFAGYNGKSSLEVGKEIDGISGATISVFGITADIQGKTGVLKELLK